MPLKQTLLSAAWPVAAALIGSLGPPAPASAQQNEPAAPQSSLIDDNTPPSSVGSTPSGPAVDPAAKAKLRQREGAKLTDRRGRFERRGDRYVFLSEDGATHFVVVENLMLERVANMLDDAAGGELLWNVSGVITEFRGSNYVLLHRAVVKASAGPNEPARLEEPLAGRPAAVKGTR